MAVYKTEVSTSEKFLQLTIDGVEQYPPFNIAWVHIKELTSNNVVLEDGAKTIQWIIPLDEYFQTDGTTAIDTEAKVIAWLDGKIG